MQSITSQFSGRHKVRVSPCTISGATPAQTLPAFHPDGRAERAVRQRSEGDPRATAENSRRGRIPGDSGRDTLRARIPATDVESIRSHFPGWDKIAISRCTIYGATPALKSRPQEGFPGAQTTFAAPNSTLSPNFPIRSSRAIARCMRASARDLLLGKCGPAGVICSARPAQIPASKIPKIAVFKTSKSYLVRKPILLIHKDLGRALRKNRTW